MRNQRIEMMIMLVAIVISCLQSADAFQNNALCTASALIRTSNQQLCTPAKHFRSKARLSMANDEQYQNKVAELLSNFLPNTDKTSSSDEPDPLAGIDFQAPKYQWNGNMEALAQTLDAELIEKEWFVTGNVNPRFFSDDFQFSDPDVSVDGIEGTYQKGVVCTILSVVAEMRVHARVLFPSFTHSHHIIILRAVSLSTSCCTDYARGVYKIFDQETSRAEIISTVVNTTVPNTITCTWRLSGKVSIGPGLTIKPYIVYTDFTVNAETGLLIFQEDRFSIPGWDIFLSALFPFLIGKLTSDAAPPVEPRVVAAPAASNAPSFFDSLFKK